MKFNQFKKYLKEIVLYQAHNSYNKNAPLKTRCKINFTTRQLAGYCGVSHTTIHRWLKKLQAEKSIFFLSYKKTANAAHRSMIFYYHYDVYKVLIAKFKKWAYKAVKRINKFKENVTPTKYINIYIKKYQTVWHLDQAFGEIHMPDGKVYSKFDLDLRFKNSKRPDNLKGYADNKQVFNAFESAMKFLQ